MGITKIGCIKTGCNVVFSDFPDNVYRADAHYYNGCILFRTNAPVFAPKSDIDFVIHGGIDFLEFDRVILVANKHVAITSQTTFETVNKYFPEVAMNSYIKLS
jgi:hypothetical protein